MQPFSKALQCSLVAALALPLCAQDLAPRAYVITPVSSNAATFTYSFYENGVNFNGAVPVTNATGTFSVLGSVNEDRESKCKRVEIYDR